MREISGKDPYYEALYIAFSWVLKRTQMKLEVQWEEEGKKSLRPLAVDFYGVIALNRVYGPLKYRFLFSEQKSEDIYYFLSKIDFNQLVSLFGDVSYVSLIPFQDKILKLALAAEAG
jgi:hypothetical protein